MNAKSVLVGVIVGGIAVSVAIALASIPDSGGVVHACYLNSNSPNKSIKLLDTAKAATCPRGWLPLDWNETGPAGPQGPSDLWNVFSGAGLPQFTETQVARLTLPAGRYLVSAHVSVTNYAVSAPLTCHLYVNYNGSFSNSIDQVSEVLGASGSAGSVVDFPLQGSVFYTAPGYAIVTCEEDQNKLVGDPAGASATLDAIAVATIH
jgi:hypothetical protein